MKRITSGAFHYNLTKKTYHMKKILETKNGNIDLTLAATQAAAMLAASAAVEPALPAVVEPAPPTVQKAVRAWPTRAEFASKLAHTRQRNLIIRVPGIMAAAPRVHRLTPLYLSGDAGTGKGYSARAIADALGWRWLPCLPAQLEKVLAVNFADGKPAVPTVLFVDESHDKEGSIDTLLLQLTNTSDSPVYAGGEGENTWTFDQRIHLLVLASNRGEPNPALVGPTGRMAEIAMLPFQGADLTWWLDTNTSRIEREYGAILTPAARQFVRRLTSGIARNVQDLLDAIAQVYAGDKITADMVRKVAMSLTDRNDKPIICPAGVDGRIVSLMQTLASKGICREGTLKGAMGQEAKHYLPLKRIMLARDWIEACPSGFRLTKTGLVFIREVDAIIDTPVPEHATPAPVKAKGMQRVASTSKKGGRTV